MERRWSISTALQHTGQGAGWMMWTLKTEDSCAPEWDFLLLLQIGVIPADLCARETVCTF
jgi:hypothetical protein